MNSLYNGEKRPNSLTYNICTARLEHSLKSVTKRASTVLFYLSFIPHKHSSIFNLIQSTREGEKKKEYQQQTQAYHIHGICKLAIQVHWS